MSEYAALDKLARALNPLPGLAVDGAHAISTTGTVNIVGAGSGGTSSTDEAAFTTGATGLTPAGAWTGTFGADVAASVGQGKTAVPKMSGQRILYSALATPSGGDVMDNANTAVRVNVVAGGAGGGVANITVVGTNNTQLHVGQASWNNPGVNWPQMPNQDGAAWLPIAFASGYFPTINTVGGGGLGSVGIYGSALISGTVNTVGSTFAGVIAGAGSVNVIGSVNVSGSLGIWGSVSVTGSVNVSGSLGIWGSVGVTGSVNVTQGTLPLPTTVASFMYSDSTNSAVRVNVVAGGAGGGVANMTVVGTANTAFHVGQASYNNPGINWPQMPNIDGAAWLPTAFASGFFPSVWVGGLQYGDSTNSAVRVNVVAGGAGGGVANITVVGTSNVAYHVGQASWNNPGVNWPNMANFDGAAWLPVAFASGYFPTVNNGPIVGSVNVSGSLGVWGSMTIVGSVNVSGSLGVWGSMAVLGTVNTVGSTFAGVIAGAGSVNVIGSVNVSGSLGIWGSVNALASLAGVGVPQSQGLPVDPRNNIVATQWIISGNASGQFNVCPTTNSGLRAIVTSFHLTADATTAFQWCSPSGTAISGSMVLLPGAGFAMAGMFPNGPSLVGAQQAVINIRALNGSNVGGVAIGYIGNP